MGQQGKFRINLKYDELLRNRSDTYPDPFARRGHEQSDHAQQLDRPQLPVQSGTAGNSLGLDSGFANRPKIGTATIGTGTSVQIVAGQPTYPTGPASTPGKNLAVSQAIIATDIPDFQNVDLHTKRTKSEVGFGLNITRQWQVTGSLSHEKKDGMKPMSTVLAGNNAYSSANGAAIAGTTRSGDVAMVIPDLIDQHHDQYNLGIAYKDDKLFFKAAYYGSKFTNDVPYMSWQDWEYSEAKNTTAGSALLNTYPTGWTNPLAMPNVMSSAPDNEYHQLNLVGGYDFTKTTKLVLNASYGRSTQDQSFLTTTTPGVIEYGFLPESSAHALVINKSFGAKLTSRPDKAWNFTANYKYDDRDNKTPVANFGFGDVGENFGVGTQAASTLWTAAMLGWPAGTLVPGVTNVSANRPYSKKTNQLNLDGEYSFVGTSQKIRFGYDWQKIERDCPVWIQCTDAAETKENTVRTEWRGKLDRGLDRQAGLRLCGAARRQLRRERFPCPRTDGQPDIVGGRYRAGY